MKKYMMIGLVLLKTCTAKIMENPDCEVNTNDQGLLDFEGKNITKIATKAFGFFCRNVTTLDFSGNKIKSLKKDVFSGLYNLENLLLTENKINKIDAGAFSGLSQLTKLDLSYNKIEHFYRWDEKKERSILHSSFTPESFDGLSQLTELNLSHNKEILSLPSYMFTRKPKDKNNQEQNFIQLGILDLSHCTIMVIEKNAFAGLESVKILNLAGNNITQVKPSAFEPVSGAQIMVDNNDIAEVIRKSNPNPGVGNYYNITIPNT